MDLISRQAAIEKLRTNIAYIRAFGCSRAITLIDELPSADAVEVVRCKDCKYRDEMGRCEMWECYQMPDMGFCHEGVRKDG